MLLMLLNVVAVNAAVVIVVVAVYGDGGGGIDSLEQSQAASQSETIFRIVWLGNNRTKTSSPSSTSLTTAITRDTSSVHHSIPF